MKLLTFTMCIALSIVARCFADEANLVANGSFESSNVSAGVPDNWSASGTATIKQSLSLDVGHDGRRCAKLECSEFAGDGPAAHAMIAQTGTVSVRKGAWYRLAFWAKAERIKHGGVEVALSNTQPWDNAGLSEAFTPSPQWQQFAFLFQAESDVPAATSRLQFWFRSTGTLWLDDVVLAESAIGRQWFPQIPTDGVKNFLPNSSFECGGANWGSYTYGLRGWGGNLYRLEGVVDDAVAEHGKHSLKIALSPETMPVFYFDYYTPVRQPVRRVLVANQGWFHVRPGEPLTLSAFLRADAEGVAAQLAAVDAPNRVQRKQVTVGQKWQRHEFTFRPAEPFFFVAAGLDLDASNRNAATLWIDANPSGTRRTRDRLRAAPAGGVVPRDKRAREHCYDAPGRHRDVRPRFQQHGLGADNRRQTRDNRFLRSPGLREPADDHAATAHRRAQDARQLLPGSAGVFPRKLDDADGFAVAALRDHRPCAG